VPDAPGVISIEASPAIQLARLLLGLIGSCCEIAAAQFKINKDVARASHAVCTPTHSSGRGTAETQRTLGLENLRGRPWTVFARLVIGRFDDRCVVPPVDCVYRRAVHG
jgi:hypothetical protein